MAGKAGFSVRFHWRQKRAKNFPDMLVYRCLARKPTGVLSVNFPDMLV